MHDTGFEDRLRQALRAEGDSLPLTLTAGQLEQRLQLRRSERANRRMILTTAAALLVAVGAAGGLLLSNRGPTPPTGTSPSPSAPPAASPQTAAPSASLVPVDDIAPYAGWRILGRIGSPDDDSTVSLTAPVPSGVTHLLISAACRGNGRLVITDSGGGQLPVDCPIDPRVPNRTLSSVGETQEFTVDVAATGAVTFQVLVEGGEDPLRIPAVVIRQVGGDEATMGMGCGVVISLAWGYDTSDSCATTLPATPLETLEFTGRAAATVSLPGWAISDPSVACGRITTSPGDPSQFEAMSNCTAIVGLGDSAISISGLPRAANAWVLELRMTARNGAGDSFSGPFYAHIFVR
jgi:hypothetical protein